MLSCRAVKLASPHEMLISGLGKSFLGGLLLGGFGMWQASKFWDEYSEYMWHLGVFVNIVWGVCVNVDFFLGSCSKNIFNMLMRISSHPDWQTPRDGIASKGTTSLSEHQQDCSTGRSIHFSTFHHKHSFPFNTFQALMISPTEKAWWKSSDVPIVFNHSSIFSFPWLNMWPARQVFTPEMPIRVYETHIVIYWENVNCC